jgi:hypothetical protein
MDSLTREYLKNFQKDMAEAHQHLQALIDAEDNPKTGNTHNFLALSQAQKRLLNTEIQIRRLYQSYDEEAMKG